MIAINEKVWEDVLDALRPEVDANSFETWFAPVKFHSFDHDTLHLVVPSDLYRKWLLSNYYERILEAVGKITGFCPEIKFLTHDSGEEESEDNAQAIHTNSVSPAGGMEQKSRGTRMNERYTFENFVVGESNRFAHAAARAVADPASRSYNPLFIYGGTGLGKTHLMQAIGHEFLRADPKSVVLYVTSEQFMNDFINALDKDSQYNFRNYYRNADLLLLDDVQFFAGKEQTQIQFFHTFNALYDSAKKIVISSDRPPKELIALEERLRSRFEWGLIVDIQPPDLETRIAILRKKAEPTGLRLPDDVLVYIAERIDTNVRFLEGALVRLQAYVTLHKKKTLNTFLAREVIGDLLTGNAREEVSIATIQAAVCEYFDIKLADLIGHARGRKYSMPRHVAQYLCRKLSSKSLPEIGVYFGGRDHSSILHACRKIEKTLEKDHNLESMVNYLTKSIREKS